MDNKTCGTTDMTGAIVNIEKQRKVQQIVTTPGSCRKVYGIFRIAKGGDLVLGENVMFNTREDARIALRKLSIQLNDDNFNTCFRDVDYLEVNDKDGERFGYLVNEVKINDEYTIQIQIPISVSVRAENRDCARIKAEDAIREFFIEDVGNRKSMNGKGIEMFWRDRKFIQGE